MHFHFCAANHTIHGQGTLDEMYAWYSNGLIELGHKVTFSKSHVDTSAINIFWEFFLPSFGKTIIGSGITYGIIATEIPDGGGFNWRREPDWVSRWHGFSEAAKGASFIWTTVNQAVNFYSQFAPTTFTEFGYCKSLELKDYNFQPKNDFCFYGLRTPYRQKVFEELQKFALVEWPEKFLEWDEVNNLLLNSKICLNFKQSPNWPIPSPTRIGRILHARRVCASEFTTEDTLQSAIVGKASESQNFADYASSLLSLDWKSKAQENLERYKSELPMRVVMEEAIDLSLDIKRDGNTSTISFKLHPELIERTEAFAILKFRSEYWAISNRLNNFNLDSNDHKLIGLLARGLIIKNESLDELKANLKRNYLQEFFLQTVTFLRRCYRKGKRIVRA